MEILLVVVFQVDAFDEFKGWSGNGFGEPSGVFYALESFEQLMTSVSGGLMVENLLGKRIESVLRFIFEQAGFGTFVGNPPCDATAV